MKDSEIDALVAEKVMGFKKSYTPPGFPQQWELPSENPDPKHRKEYPHAYKGFAPSKDIAAAWMVVEKVGFLSLEQDEDDKIWKAYFNGRMLGTGPTAPMAICDAALRAVKTGEGK